MTRDTNEVPAEPAGPSNTAARSRAQSTLRAPGRSRPSTRQRPGSRGPVLKSLFVLLLSVVVVVGTFAGPAGAVSSVVSFEEFEDGRELTTEYLDEGVRFEAQSGQTAGVIVVTCGGGGGYCEVAQTGQQAAITPEIDGVTPTGFGFPREPMVAVFEEPQESVSLSVQDAGDLQGSQTATLTARDGAGNIVDTQSVQFEVNTGWHQLEVSADSAVISAVTLTLAWEGNLDDPHNLMAVDDLRFQRNDPPNAVFDPSPQNPVIGEEVTFDASASDDIDGTIVEYRWDFNGDNVIDEVTEQPVVRTSFQDPGTYTVTLQVVDNGSAMARTSQTVTVEGARARCSVSATQIEPGDQVVLDASASNADLVRFDVDGDGDFDRIDQGDFLLAVVYDEAGTFQPRVRARLGDHIDTTRCPAINVNRFPPGNGADIVAGGMGGVMGLWFLRRVYTRLEKVYREVVNRDNGPDNSPPSAVLDLAPEEPEPGQPVFVDGTRSSDPDEGDHIASYRWSIDDRNLVAPRFVHSFLEEGEHVIKLQVFDTHGLADSTEQTVSVNATRGEFLLDAVNPDAPGDDHVNLDEEYLVFRNGGDEALDVGGWTVHDTAEAEGRVEPGEHQFRFPDGFEIEPDARVSLHTGPEPQNGGGGAEPSTDSQLYWNRDRAVWNNDEDVIVVEDDEGQPVLAVRYRRTDSGGYELEHVDVAVLDGWFGRVVVSGREEAPLVSAVPAAGLGIAVVSWLATTLWGATLLQGPVRFLQSWANITGFVVSAAGAWAATTGAGLLPASVEPIVPMLLVIASTAITLVGGVGVVVQYVVSELWAAVTGILS